MGNIRVVLTEQQDTAKYLATFETDARAKESALFHNITESAFSVQSVAGYPADPTTDPNLYTSRLNGDVRKTGAAITLKVMAGDKVDLAVKYWYPQYVGIKDENPVTPDDLMGVLVSALSGDASALSGGKATPGQLSQPGIVPSALGDFLATQDDEANLSSLPKAFLNWVLLDEQFKFVPGGSGFIRVDGYSSDMQTMAQQELPIAKSGYLFVYLSNETKGENVFFDNLLVQHYTGPLSETDDYTAWGLGMKMPSSKAFGRVENKKKYNGYEKNETFDLNLYESFYRTHDPQLGRFWQLDPRPTDFESLYAAMGNNPVLMNDILGDTAWITTAHLKDKDGNTTTVRTVHVRGKVLDLAGVRKGGGGCTSSKPALPELVEGINTRMSAEKGRIERIGYTEKIRLDVKYTVAESMDDVKPSDHLLLIVDDVLGKADPALGGGDAGGLSGDGKVAYVENSRNINFLVESSIHEIGHNFGLGHVSNGTGNYMSYEQSKNGFTAEQLSQISSSTFLGTANKGANSEISNRSSSNWFYHTSTNEKPYYKNVSVGDRIPKRIINPDN